MLNETYHSHHGALQESQYVFIRQGLDAWREQHADARSLQVLEIGFGTGLNALLSLQWAKRHGVQLRFTTLEPYPISLALVQELNYADLLGGQADMLRLHEASWEEDVIIEDSFVLHKTTTPLQEIDFSSSSYDVVFFDAFAPSKQPELWEKPLLAKVAAALATEGLFCTYCAKGQLKRDLNSLALTVETLPGAPGKKEMVRARKGH
ncbi:tRNA (5-methylaminomethyl-2-thiouridine)(34)-methyltransferase MnmD [Cesiribacter andamanensis]|uniref:tRNA (5-methylaminomethyl-2-thiouridine)(34)-methyltransferase MnmD n=1 Tax=Cesiribacter andamanensis TaxID=649507 RepID=UPI001F000FF3|nr:tRNA (5-methylaminomethyl-2-thiouridine)(34)-methyltransferase MnmD [Cesiribacter andamanensis]